MPVEDRAGEAGGTGPGTLDEATLRALIEHIPVTVYIDRLDETASNVYTSPQLEAELGYTVAEWVSDKELYAKVLHPECRHVFRIKSERSALRKSPWSSAGLGTSTKAAPSGRLARVPS